MFRTFGADIKEVVDEMNMFATGQHPCYPEVGASPHASAPPCMSMFSKINSRDFVDENCLV